MAPSDFRLVVDAFRVLIILTEGLEPVFNSGNANEVMGEVTGGAARQVEGGGQNSVLKSLIITYLMKVWFVNSKQ